MFISVVEENLKNTLLEKQYKLIKEKHDINGKTIWVFEDSSNRFCFDIDDDIKSKCFITDRLTMSF